MEAALFPLGFWLPDVYAAVPEPGAAVISSAATGVASILLYRMVLADTLVSRVVAVLASLGVVVSVAHMYKESDLGRVVAYSSMFSSNAVLLAFSSKNSLAVSTALVYYLAHSLSKTSAFILAGGLRRDFGHSSVQDLRGVAYGWGGDEAQPSALVAGGARSTPARVLLGRLLHSCRPVGVQPYTRRVVLVDVDSVGTGNTERVVHAGVRDRRA